MIWTIDYHESDSLVSIVTEGELTLTSYKAFAEDIASKDYWCSPNNILVDHRKLVLGQTDMAGMMTAVSFHMSAKKKLTNSRVGILVKDYIALGELNTFRRAIEGKTKADMKFFLDEEEARNWTITGER